MSYLKDKRLMIPIFLVLARLQQLLRPARMIPLRQCLLCCLAPRTTAVSPLWHRKGARFDLTVSGSFFRFCAESRGACAKCGKRRAWRGTNVLSGLAQLDGRRSLSGTLVPPVFFSGEDCLYVALPRTMVPWHPRTPSRTTGRCVTCPHYITDQSTWFCDSSVMP